MPTFIKTGYWDKKAKAPDGWLDLNLLISQNAPPSSIATLGTSLYSTNPAAGIGFSQNNGIFFGALAGENTNNSDSSIFLGTLAGFNSSNAAVSNFIGASAGRQGNYIESNFIGFEAGSYSTSSYTNSIGSSAGIFSSAQNSNFIGNSAGKGATNANNCNFLGQEAGMNSTGNNVNAFGFQAHKGGTLSGQTVFANATLPSFANRAAATTAITVANGAVAGNTYLYYNQTTFAIEGVRL